MKFRTLLVLLMAFSLTIATKVSLFAQDEEPVEMSEEEWQRQIDELTAKKNDLTKQLGDLTTSIDAMKKTSAEKDAMVQKAEDDLYASVGSTKSGVADFRKKFESVEKTINSKSGTKEDAEKMFAEIEASRIKCLPEFWDRYNAMKKKLADWGPPVVSTAGTYTVVRGDCLWKIAGMKNIYGNVRLWPALWDANRDGVVSAPPGVSKTIRNPNLIYPGQVLRVPALSEADKTKYQDEARRYRRVRRIKKVVTSDVIKKDEKKDVLKKDVVKKDSVKVVPKKK